MRDLIRSFYNVDSALWMLSLSCNRSIYCSFRKVEPPHGLPLQVSDRNSSGWVNLWFGSSLFHSSEQTKDRAEIADRILAVIILASFSSSCGGIEG